MNMHLTDPVHFTIPAIPELPPVPETGLPAGAIPIKECHESLDPVSVASMPAYAIAGWSDSHMDIYVRTSVNSRLIAAERTLADGFGLIALDGWRHPALQRALYEHYTSSGTPSGYVSDPDSDVLVPPHTTGGAIDVTLSLDGTAIALGTQFDDFSEVARPRHFETDLGTEPYRTLRRLLTSVLVAQGFTPHPLEWWHFSYGDQIWAANHGIPVAIYGPVAPAK